MAAYKSSYDDEDRVENNLDVGFVAWCCWWWWPEGVASVSAGVVGGGNDLRVLPVVRRKESRDVVETGWNGYATGKRIENNSNRVIIILIIFIMAAIAIGHR